MASFEELIKELTGQAHGVERYNPEKIVLLERCVQAMISEQKYDKDAILNLLQLYQLNYDKYNENITCLALLKALSQMPRKDFLLAKCLLSENRIKTEKMAMLINLSYLLERNDFSTFWKLMNGEYQPVNDKSEPFPCPKAVCDLVAECPGFIDCLRQYVCESITNTFQSIEENTLKRLLGNVKSADLKCFARRWAWEAVPEKGVYFIKDHAANIKQRVLEEKISISDTLEVVLKMSQPNPNSGKLIK